jgi:uncharacterized LabA/DUF88 family protein
MQILNEKRLAVLIDADNVSYKNIMPIMSEIAKYGIPTYKRIYGDWTTPNLAGWKIILLDNGITPIQQYGYTVGKNSTDSAMIIDAMDILYSGNVDGFCLVSSDSDFTRLALRLREAGKIVIGIGEKKTPKPFISACEKFIYTEIISPQEEKPKKANLETKVKNEKNDSVKKDSSKNELEKITNLIKQTINDVADEDGFAFLSDIFSLIAKKQPDFDCRNYGFNKASKLVASLNKFDIEDRKLPNQSGKLLYVKNRSE